MQSHAPLCNGRSTLDSFRRYAHARVQTESRICPSRICQARDWLRKIFCIANITSEINCHFKKFLTIFILYIIVQKKTNPWGE